MRPILVQLGPWEPWQIVFVFATLLAITLLWRRIEARLEGVDELRPIRWPATLGGCILGSAALYLLVNRFAPVEIKSYGVMLLVAFTAGLWWLGRNAPAQLELADIIDLGLTLLISAVVGARILYVAIEWGAPGGYAANPKTVLNVWEAACRSTEASWGR
jgi:prolipoprotein diacylglyceryltransferase